jgi:hypothetical protein
MSKLKDLLNSPRLKTELAMLSSQENITLQRNCLKKLITKISDAYGGDSPDWLEKAATEIMSEWDDRLGEAITLLNNTIIPKEIKL